MSDLVLMLVAEGRRTRRDQEQARGRDSSIKDAQCTQAATEAILKNWLVWPVNVWHPNVKVKPRSLWAAETLPETGNNTVLSLFLPGCEASYRNLSRVTDSFAFSGFMGKDPKGRLSPPGIQHQKNSYPACGWPRTDPVTRSLSLGTDGAFLGLVGTVSVVDVYPSSAHH